MTQLGASTWKYDFTVTNKAMTYYSQLSDTVRLTDYLLPYFSDAAISVSQVPTGWAWRIDTDDRFNLGHGAQTLHWYSSSFSSGIAGGIYSFGNVPDVMGDTLGGFSYMSGFAPVKAPFMGGFSASPGLWLQGDPALPGSPDAQASGLNQPFSVTSVPEPASFALMAVGLMLVGVTGRVSRKS